MILLLHNTFLFMHFFFKLVKSTNVLISLSFVLLKKKNNS